MRTFKRSLEMTPYVTRELENRGVQYTLGVDERGEYIIEVPLSGAQFREVILAAKAAKKTEEVGILHVTRTQMRTGELMKITDGKNFGFIVI